MKVNPLLKHSIALALCSSGLMTSGQALGATCIANMSSGNWNSSGSLWAACTPPPAAGDTVLIMSAAITVSLNGVSTPTLGSVQLESGNAILNDAGGAAGNLNAGSLSIINTNTLDFRVNNSNITLSGNFTVGSGTLSGKAYLGSGTVKIGGNLSVLPHQAVSTNGLFEMISGGTLEFTNSGGATIDSQLLNTYPATVKLKGTNTSNRLTLKSAGTTNFTGGGIIQLDYVHFATGTWTSSATNISVTNCTKAAGVTVPSGWGCTLPVIPAAVDLTDKEQPHTFAREISQ